MIIITIVRDHLLLGALLVVLLGRQHHRHGAVRRAVIVIGAGEVLMLVLAEIDLSAGQVYLTAPWFAFWFWHAGYPSA